MHFLTMCTSSLTAASYAITLSRVAWREGLCKGFPMYMMCVVGCGVIPTTTSVRGRKQGVKGAIGSLPCGGWVTRGHGAPFMLSTGTEIKTMETVEVRFLTSTHIPLSFVSSFLSLFLLLNSWGYLQYRKSVYKRGSHRHGLVLSVFRVLCIHLKSPGEYTLGCIPIN
uniref:Secreted protein n=1 Tax=Ascaris lumbricoides TaxID=6252 RepID=A0A0M3I2Q3_ASCLU